MSNLYVRDAHPVCGLRAKAAHYLGDGIPLGMDIFESAYGSAQSAVAGMTSWLIYPGGQCVVPPTGALLP
jgi:hypothetical protein